MPRPYNRHRREPSPSNPTCAFGALPRTLIIMRSIFLIVQIESMIIGAKNEYIIGGRGLGKSEGFDARVLLRNIFAMPRSAGALLSPSYTKLKTQTFPAIANALNRWGYAEGLHYYVWAETPPAVRIPPPHYSAVRLGNVLPFLRGDIA